MGKLTEGYTLVLALEDFLPVILSSIGMFFLARLVRAQAGPGIGRMARLGWIFVTLGGLSKATWKLIMAATGEQVNIVVMDDALFWFLGPGFVLMAYAVSYTFRIMAGKALRVASYWIVPLVVIGIFVASAAFMLFSQPSGRTWNFIMLGMTTLGNFVLGGMLIYQSAKRGLGLMAALFGFNLFAIIILTGMARIADQTVSMQWTEQILNTLSNAGFAFACYRLCTSAAPRSAVETVAAA